MNEMIEKMKIVAEIHRFRMPLRNETEMEYKKSLIEHFYNLDSEESKVIEYGVGWDKWINDMVRFK